MADQLDDLTNDQLRLRLLEYGMANMPVTSTTRKVLIKKLRNVLEGGASGDKTPTAKSTRRETIAVARFSSGDDSDEPAAPTAAAIARATAQRKTKAPSSERSSGRRATIGVSAAASSKPVAPELVVSQLTPSQPKPITTRRSSGRLTPSAISDGAKPSAPISRAPAVITLQEDSDDEIEFVPVVRPTASPGRSRQSRSPSMGKSETVVTSFKQVQAPAAIAEASDESDAMADTSGEAEMRSFNISNSGQHGSNAALNYGTSGGGSPLKSTLANKQYFSSSKSSSTTTTTKTSYAPSAVDLNVSAGRRYTSGAGISTAPTTTWQLPATPARQSDQHDDLIVTDAHTPYLSDFTRRLSRLRAEPLSVPGADATAAGSSGTARRVPVRRESTYEDATDAAATYAYRTSTRVHGRQPTASAADQQVAGNSLVLSAKRALAAFEQRFRYQIWAVVALLLAVFVFTMVFA